MRYFLVALLLGICLFGAFTGASSGCSDGSSHSISTEAVVFYRAFNWSPAGAGSCWVHLAIPARAESPNQLPVIGDTELLLSLADSANPVVMSASSLAEASGPVLAGSILTVQDGVVFFEPHFSKLKVSGAACSQLQQESNKIKYVLLELVEKDQGSDSDDVDSDDVDSDDVDSDDVDSDDVDSDDVVELTFSSIQFHRLEEGEPFFFK